MVKTTKKSKTNEKLREFFRESEKEIQEKAEEVNIEIPKQAEFFKTPHKTRENPNYKNCRFLDKNKF